MFSGAIHFLVQSTMPYFDEDQIEFNFDDASKPLYVYQVSGVKLKFFRDSELKSRLVCAKQILTVELVETSPLPFYRFTDWDGKVFDFDPISPDGSIIRESIIRLLAEIEL